MSVHVTQKKVIFIYQCLLSENIRITHRDDCFQCKQEICKQSHIVRLRCKFSVLPWHKLMFICCLINVRRVRPFLYVDSFDKHPLSSVTSVNDVSIRYRRRVILKAHNHKKLWRILKTYKPVCLHQQYLLVNRISSNVINIFKSCLCRTYNILFH